MTAFKGYMKILKKNIGLVMIYLVIFFSIAMALQAAARKEHLEDFQKTSVNVAVADPDDSILSHALTDYLRTIHHVSEISSDPAVMQEELYYRNAEYIVQIPEDFYETCIVQGNPVSVTKVPGSYTSFYVDQQINAWLNNVRTYITAGFSREEAAKRCARSARSRSFHVSGRIDHDRNSGIYVLFPLCALSVSGCPVLFHGLYPACFPERRYPEAYAGFFCLHAPPGSRRTARHVYDRYRTMADRCYRFHHHVSESHPLIRCSGLLSSEHLPDDDCCAVPFLSDRPFYQKQQHAQWNLQYCFSWHVFPVRGLCAYECYGQKGA